MDVFMTFPDSEFLQFFPLLMFLWYEALENACIYTVMMIEIMAEVRETLRVCLHLCAHAKLILCTALQFGSNYNFNHGTALDKINSFWLNPFEAQFNDACDQGWTVETCCARKDNKMIAF